MSDSLRQKIEKQILEYRGSAEVRADAYIQRHVSVNADREVTSGEREAIRSVFVSGFLSGCLWLQMGEPQDPDGFAGLKSEIH